MLTRLLSQKVQPSLFNNLYRYRRYIWVNALHELRFQYAGTGLGVLWNLIHPLCEILIYTVVFSLLLGRGSGDFSYALYLTSGLLPWRAFVDGFTRGGNAFVVNAHHLKRLALPSEIFIAKAIITATLLLTIYLVLLFPLAPIGNGQLGWSIISLPVLALLLQIMALGMALGLASLQTLFPDIRQIIQFLMPLWSWMMPLFYPDTAIPEVFRPWLYLNPIYGFLHSIRYIFLENQSPKLFVWGIMLGWSTFFLILGTIIHNIFKDEVKDSL
jgi:ABC-type polysaccharide/polyol phosphate export permease